MAPIDRLSTAATHFLPLPLAERHPLRQPIVPRLGRPPRIHLWHIGCQMNDADRIRLGEQLAEIGCVPEVGLEDADVAILITCAVRQNAEQKVYGKIGALAEWKAVRPGRAIALTGCMGVEHGDSLLTRLPDLDYVFDVREPDGFLNKLQSLHGGDFDGPVALPPSDRLTAYVPVIGGCNEMCTYCIVPFVRGREVSRGIPEIVGDVRRLVDRGVREVTLLGQNVNSYRDPATGTGLPGLLAAVDGVPGLARQRFLTSHPRNAVPELFEAIRDLRTVCEQLHLPVQAGDDDLLKRMRRVYTIAEYRAVIERAVATVPGLAVSTDIITGFCGETDEEFLGTERLMRDLRFDVVHLQAYSVRPGTAAARRPDDVPTAVKKERLNRLLDLQRVIAQEINARLVGQDVEILIEGAAGDGRLYGRTRQNKVAWLPAGGASVGDAVSARVTGVTAWQLTTTPVLATA